MRLGKALLAGAVALGVSACFSDPTSDLQGGPAKVQTNVSFVTMGIGDTATLEIRVVDNSGNQLAFSDPTYTSAAPAVATAEPLTDTNLVAVPGNTIWKGYIIGVAPGATTVVIGAAGLEDTVSVVVFPDYFTGTITPSPLVEGEMFTIASTSQITFDPAGTTVTIDGVAAYFVTVTANQITGYVPDQIGGTGLTVTLGNVKFLGSFAIGEIDAATTVSVTSYEPANDGPAGGLSYATPTVVGDSIVIVGAMNGAGWAHGSPGGSDDFDDFISLVVAGTDSLEIIVEWANDAIDIDATITESDGSWTCAYDGCAGVTGSMPEVMKFRLGAAGTYQLNVELWDDHGEATPEPYRVKVFKRG
jgi:uncharacterized protein (TIGR03437 family)